MYIHVPTAWLGMGGWSGVALSSIAYLVWRHPLANVAARAIALPGALFAFLCLATGSIWGRPTWGTWWQWDGRLTSMLLLFFVYLGYMALARADQDRGGDGRIPAIYGVAGIGAAADHSLFGGMVEHAAPGAVDRVDQFDDRQVDPVAALVYARRVHLVLRRHRADADAHHPRLDQGRSADAADGGGVSGWSFVIAAYAVTLVASAGIALSSWLAMRAAERRLP